jgi:hypothetical protein
MKMIRKIEQPEAKFDLYFMGYDSPKAVSHANHFSDREGLIELTHNYGTENDPNYKVREIRSLTRVLDIHASVLTIFKLLVRESRMLATNSRRN